MPVYNRPGSINQVGPGESLTLFDGSETPSLALASVAFARGGSGGQSQVYSTFIAQGMPSDMTIDIQSSNVDQDTRYKTIATLTSELASPAGVPFYTDSGSPLFYRAKVSAYTSGDMPSLTVAR